MRMSLLQNYCLYSRNPILIFFLSSWTISVRFMYCCGFLFQIYPGTKLWTIGYFEQKITSLTALRLDQTPAC